MSLRARQALRGTNLCWRGILRWQEGVERASSFSREFLHIEAPGQVQTEQLL
jgi:hypothetical protein